MRKIVTRSGQRAKVKTAMDTLTELLHFLFGTPKGVVLLCAAGVLLAFLVAFVAEHFLQKDFYAHDETWEERERRQQAEECGEECGEGDGVSGVSEGATGAGERT